MIYLREIIIHGEAPTTSRHQVRLLARNPFRAPEGVRQRVENKHIIVVPVERRQAKKQTQRVRPQYAALHATIKPRYAEMMLLRARALFLEGGTGL